MKSSLTKWIYIALNQIILVETKAMENYLKRYLGKVTVCVYCTLKIHSNQIL